MNKKRYTFLLHFVLFSIIFFIAFLLIILLIDKTPHQDFRLLLVKIVVLATLSSGLYNFLNESDTSPAD